MIALRFHVFLRLAKLCYQVSNRDSLVLILLSSFDGYRRISTLVSTKLSQFDMCLRSGKQAVLAHMWSVNQDTLLHSE